METPRGVRWQQIVARVAGEYRDLSETEKGWIISRIEQVQALQMQLHQLFDKGQGALHCRDCEGECCARGHNHATLINLLGFIAFNRMPPTADFSKTCPFLGSHGCLLAVTARPYNCVSFICDRIESALTAQEIDSFYFLEKRLRALYLEFSDRYLGASMSGLLLSEGRLEGRSFFSLKNPAGGVQRRT